MNKIKGIFFDLDGTLIDTLEGITESINHCLDLRGLKNISIDQCKSMIGWSFYVLIKKAFEPVELSEKEIKNIHIELLNYYQKKDLSINKVYDGVFDLLNFLKGTDLALYVVTNKEQKSADMVINYFFKDIFKGVSGASENLKKPNPEMIYRLSKENLNNCLFIGDSEVDIETAINANCIPLGVSWGFRTIETLKNKKSDIKIINKPMDLIKFYSEKDKCLYF